MTLVLQQWPWASPHPDIHHVPFLTSWGPHNHLGLLRPSQSLTYFAKISRAQEMGKGKESRPLFLCHVGEIHKHHLFWSSHSCSLARKQLNSMVRKRFVLYKEVFNSPFPSAKTFPSQPILQKFACMEGKRLLCPELVQISRCRGFFAQRGKGSQRQITYFFANLGIWNLS